MGVTSLIEETLNTLILCIPAFKAISWHQILREFPFHLCGNLYSLFVVFKNKSQQIFLNRGKYAVPAVVKRPEITVQQLIRHIIRQESGCYTCNDATRICVLINRCSSSIYHRCLGCSTGNDVTRIFFDQQVQQLVR